MTRPSTFSTGLFGLIVLVVAALFVFAVLKAIPVGGGLARSRWTAIAIGFLVWLGIPGVLAWAGLLDRYSPLPAPALVMIALITIGTVVLAVSPFGGRFATAIPLAGLVGYQAFRIPVEWWLHRLYGEGVIPIQMTYSGYNFDVVSGISAAALALLLLSDRRVPRVVFAWNVLGLLLLANIVGIAVLSTPVPFRQFANEPANLLPSSFPFVWLPTFLVQAALFGHLVVFKVLRRRAAT